MIGEYKVTKIKESTTKVDSTDSKEDGEITTYTITLKSSDESEIVIKKVGFAPGVSLHDVLDICVSKSQAKLA